MQLSHWIIWICAWYFLSLETYAQLFPEEWKPLLEGLNNPPTELLARVPLMTNDSTKSPLVDLQIFAPPPSRKEGGKGCMIELLKHSFGVNSFNVPAIRNYAPPSEPGCGEIGKWAGISLNLTVYCIGTQYDRFGSIYLSHAEIWRTSSAEPTKNGTVWITVKDVTHFAPLFSKSGDLMMDFSNIIAPELLLDGVFDVTLTATFTPPAKNSPGVQPPDLIIPLTNLSPTLPNLFTISDDAGASINVTIPQDSVEAYVEIFASGNSAEEFWYSNTPDEFLPYFPESTGVIGKGPFREIQVLIDNQLAGVVWPYGVIYTGGITPTNWRPLTAYGAYDSPTYWIDISPFLPQLVSDRESHTVTLAVRGQGRSPSFNSNWFVSGSIHLRRGSTRTTGKMRLYQVPEVEIKTTGDVSEGNHTVRTHVTARRKLKIESVLRTSKGEKIVSFNQDLQFLNTAQYADNGWLQWVNQTINGTTGSTHGGVPVLRDGFNYPLNIFSNYSDYTAQFGSYGSEVNQTYTRALKPPFGIYKGIHSVQHARGSVEMDDWPGLRHAIRGKGATDQRFAYIDGRGGSYFRDAATKNDGWVRDSVWGSLRQSNPAVPRSQWYGPEGGPGF